MPSFSRSPSSTLLSLGWLVLAICAGCHALPTSRTRVTSRHNARTVASAWFAGWHAGEGFDVQDINWASYTHMTYSFAETTPDVRVLNLNDSNPNILPSFVREAHKNGVKALVSVGGWSGSRYWSTNVGSAENRTAFVNTLMTFVNDHKLDGLDFDWEFPGKQGIGSNSISVNDTANYLLFLQELRQHPVGKNITLSAAVSVAPFSGPDGNPLGDLSAFGQLFDWISIMNYDVWGSWSASVGPNAPLNDACAPPDKRSGSAMSAVSAWTNAGIPPQKITLGVPSYGHSFRVAVNDAFQDGSTTELSLYPPFDANDQPAGDAWDGASGGMEFWGMIQEGYLDVNGNIMPGIAFRYDDCSQTPYVYNTITQIMVSFDNTQSFAAKGNFIAQQGLAGFSMWEAGGDSNNELLNSIRKAAGFGS